MEKFGFWRSMSTYDKKQQPAMVRTFWGTPDQRFNLAWDFAEKLRERFGGEWVFEEYP